MTTIPEHRQCRKEDALMIYDKGEYHLESLPKGKDAKYAFLHLSYYYAWLIEKGFAAPDYWEDESERRLFDEVVVRRELPSKLLEVTDGVLSDEMMNDDGNEFSSYYFEGVRMLYLGDFFDALKDHFSREESWDDYELLRSKIERRYSEWLEAGKPAQPYGDNFFTRILKKFW